MRSVVALAVCISWSGCGTPVVDSATTPVGSTSVHCDSRVLFYSKHWGRDGTLQHGPECLAPEMMPAKSSVILVGALNDRRTVWRRTTNTGDVVLLTGGDIEPD